MSMKKTMQCHHMTNYMDDGFEIERGKPKKGQRKTYLYRTGMHLEHNCMAFGEPAGWLTIGVFEYEDDRQEEYATLRVSPEDAIMMGKEIIRRAKLARALRKRWERQRVVGYLPIAEAELDLEDKGATSPDDIYPSRIDP